MMRQAGRYEIPVVLSIKLTYTLMIFHLSFHPYHHPPRKAWSKVAKQDRKRFAWFYSFEQSLQETCAQRPVSFVTSEGTCLSTWCTRRHFTDIWDGVGVRVLGGLGFGWNILTCNLETGALYRGLSRRPNRWLMTPSESKRLQLTLQPLHGILECQAMLSHTDFFTVCKTRPSSTQNRGISGRVTFAAWILLCRQRGQNWHAKLRCSRALTCWTSSASRSWIDTPLRFSPCMFGSSRCWCCFQEPLNLLTMHPFGPTTHVHNRTFPVIACCF